MLSGAILGKTTKRDNEILQKNEEFLKKKRKQSGKNFLHTDYNSKGYSIKYSNKDHNVIDLISNEKEEENLDNVIKIDDDSEGSMGNVKNVRIISRTNMQLEEDDMEYRSMCDVSNSGFKSKDKKKLESDLGLGEDDEEYREEDGVKINNQTSSKSTRSDRKRRKRRDNTENDIVMKEYKNSSTELVKVSKTAFEAQHDFIGIPATFTTYENAINISSSLSLSKSANFSNITEDIYPWITEKSSSERGMLKLHYEILEFYEFMKPTAEEDKLRERTYFIVKDLLKKNWPDLKVKKFGSFPNKIHLPDSDVDIVVLSDNNTAKDQTKILKKILNELHSTDPDRTMVDYIKFIDARVPIIRATMKETKINMDISANRKNGYEAKKVIKRVLEDYPCMRPLIYVLKYFLRQRKLNESYTGGISSFLLFNLLFAYVQYVSKVDDFKGKTLGHLLTGFLQFYSFDFNFEDVGISIRHGGYFYKKSESHFSDKRNTLLSVENFQELDQDVGKGSYKFRRVLDCLKQARDSLYYPSHHPIKSYLGMFIKVDNFLLERNRKLKEFNEKLK